MTQPRVRIHGMASVALATLMLAQSGCSDVSCGPTELKIGESCIARNARDAASSTENEAADSGADRTSGKPGDTSTVRRDAGGSSSDVEDPDPSGAQSGPQDGAVATADDGAACVASNEVCDQRDNDCDGAVDEEAVCAAPVSVRDISVGGGGHACAVLSSGQVKCWGNNSFGQLGLPTSDYEEPTAVPGLTNVRAVAAGFVHTCALLEDRTVRCWGDDAHNQLGNGDTDGTGSSPVAVPGINDAVELSSGYDQTCVVHSDGKLSCWGAGATPSSLPTAIAGVTNAKSVAAAQHHVCFLRSNGRASCWGDNTWGQLGNGTKGSAAAVPTDVSIAGSPSLISAGMTNACAIVGGNASCWGQDFNDLTVTVQVATRVAGLSGGLKDVSVGKGLICAVGGAGGVFCWGISNANGEIGDGTTVARPKPTAVLNVSNASKVRCADTSCCAQVLDGVRCWGGNASAQLGNNTTDPSLVPVTVLNVP